MQRMLENFEDELKLAAYDEQQCYCQNQDLGNLVALFLQSEVRDLQAGLVCGERTVAVSRFTQGEYVTADTHKHSENGTLVGISGDISSLLGWYQKTTQYINTVIRECSLTWLTFKFE